MTSAPQTPHSRRKATLRANAECLARTAFGLGTAATGAPLHSASFSRPSASVSLMPVARLFSVLNVHGATVNASAWGRTSGSSGRL